MAASGTLGTGNGGGARPRSPSRRPLSPRRLAMQRTHIVELDLTDLSYLGAAVGHTADNLVVFATGALPGERARVAIDERRRNFARGRVLEVLTAAPERVSPPCPYFGSCGGCQFQHLDYSAQVRWKSELVRRQL